MINLSGILNLQKPENSKASIAYQSKIYEYFSIRIPRSHIEHIIQSIKDERFLFFIKYGILRRYEGECDIIYVELPQIPKKLVIYRKPQFRTKSIDKLNLSKKDLPHIPLFEGEDHLKYLSLESNKITKIEPLISLNRLLYLNLYGNYIKEIDNLSNLIKLKALLLGRNKIEKIRNLNSLIELEILDLHSNHIKTIENLNYLKKLRVLNLANNLLISIKELSHNKNLEELNVRKNFIESIPDMTSDFKALKKINIGKNLLNKLEDLMEFTKLNNLEEAIIENNPILNNPQIIEQLTKISIYSKKVPILFSKSQDKLNSKNKFISPSKPLITNNINNIIEYKTNINNNIDISKSSNNVRKTSLINASDCAKDLAVTNRIKKNNTIEKHKDVIYARNKNNLNKTNNYFPMENLLQNNNNNNNNNNKNQMLKTFTMFNSKIVSIKQLWIYEMKNIISLGYNGYNNMKYTENNINQGHVEMENDTSIGLYGNCLKILMKRDFQDKVTSINFNYFCFDFILSKKTIGFIKEFKKLNTVKFNHNNLFSFYQLTKLELLPDIQNLSINDNEICNSYLLKYFISYRLNYLKSFNNQEIKKNDKVNSVKIFKCFDTIISIKENEALNKNEDENISEINIEDISDKVKYFEFIKYNLANAIHQIIFDEDNNG